MMHDEPETQTPDEFWEERYRESDRIWSGRPNAALEDVAADLVPGRALDLGCGEGADVIWLAQRGWEATGLDISATAVERARQAAEAADLNAGSARFAVQNLADWHPAAGSVDLVTASFLQSPVELPRSAVLQRAATAVATGGHLLSITHAAPPPWMAADDRDRAHTHDDHDHSFLTPEQELAGLDLEETQWQIVLAEQRTRPATGPDGETAELIDGVLLLRRS